MYFGDDAESGVAFDRFTDSAEVRLGCGLWEKVVRLVKERQMPPADITLNSDTTTSENSLWY